MDQIRIKNLELFARHGVNAAENELGQKFRVNAVLYTDIARAAADDNISRTVNYGDLCHFITDYMRAHTYKLIETVAERLAEAILLEFDRSERISRVDLEIEKPWAPIGLPLESVSVQIARSWETAYLSIGSNLGNRRAFLEEAVESLRRTPGIRVEKVSDLIETKPYGPVLQDDFLNGVIRIRTILAPHALLNLLQDIEQAAGRERTIRWGPRTLDLDLLFYGDLILNDPDLVIPHPDLQNRRFVLEPFAQIDPYFTHPVTGRRIHEMLDEISDAGSGEQTFIRQHR